MENKDPFFDFLDGTAGHIEVKPSEETRRKHLADMEAEATRLKQQRQRNRRLTGLGILTLLLLITAAFFLLPLHEPRPYEPDSPGSTPSGPMKEGTTGHHPAQSATSTPGQHQTNQTEIAPDLPATPPSISHQAEQKTVEPLKAVAPTVTIEKALTPDRYHLKIHQEAKMAQVTFATGQTASAEEMPKRPVPEPMKTKNADTLRQTQATKRHGNIFLQNFTAGIHYTPEYMFNTLDQTDKLVHNAGLEVAWHKKPFSIRTGVSLSVATGVTELEYSYNENLGLKQKLDSVSFSFDPEGRKIVPTWYFSEQTVFDTSVNVKVNNIRKRYTYLQFPLILGYDFWETSRVTLGLRAGPILQVLINTKQLDTDPSAGNNRIISINQLTPERMTTHWQALFGMNASFVLTRRLNLEVEPHVKYYFNSVYEKAATTRKPWSIELRTAVIIKF